MELRAKKSLGQHFLNSPAALAKIIEAGELKSDEIVLEIGPGTGVLTQALLATGTRVVAVEKDQRAFDLLKEKFAAQLASKSLSLHLGDILTADLASLGLADGSYKLVANIPYYITGMILERFLEHEPRPSLMVLLVQKEVADRIVARDGKESVLSVSVKAFGTPSIVAKVPRGAFVPPPTVDSAVLLIDEISDKRFRENSLDIRHFFTIVKAGFAHKRKYLKNNFSGMFSDEILTKKWDVLGLDSKCRAEDLSIEQWVALAGMPCV
jgi:16S rRNA (adenine1518-N6/adenine1519-N6)-dimethyltransferase